MKAARNHGFPSVFVDDRVITAGWQYPGQNQCDGRHDKQQHHGVWNFYFAKHVCSLLTYRAIRSVAFLSPRKS